MKSNPVSKFFINLAAGYAVDIVRGYLNEQLKNVQPSDLYDAIMNDKELWGALPQNIIEQARGYRKSFRKIFDEYADQINTQLILGWIEEDHKALYSTIINIDLNTPDQKGTRWLDKQVQKIKQEIIYM